MLAECSDFTVSVPSRDFGVDGMGARLRCTWDEIFVVNDLILHSSCGVVQCCGWDLGEDWESPVNYTTGRNIF